MKFLFVLAKLRVTVEREYMHETKMQFTNCAVLAAVLFTTLIVSIFLS